MRLVLAVVLLVAGCAADPVTEGRSTAESGTPCRPAPVVAGSPPPGAPTLPAGAVLTAVGPGTFSGRLPVDLEEAGAQVRRGLEAAGYVLTGEEDEGRSVRLKYFGVRGAGTVALARLPCPRGSTGFTFRLTGPTG